MKTIPNLGLSFQSGFILIIIVSILLTFVTYINNNLEDPITKEINENEYKLSTKEYIELYIFRVIHFISTLFTVFIPYIFKPNLYLYIVFCFYVFIAITSWQLIKECPFSIHEKQLLNKKYINGDTKIEPYLILALPSPLVFVITYIYRINLLIILFRLFQHYYLPKSKIPEAIRM
jgi:hypothetical protein